MNRATIRPAGPADWQTWRDLRLAALADAPDAFGETLANAQTRDDADWHSLVAPRPDAIRLLADLDGRPAGMCVLVISETHRAKADLYAMWVRPEARKLGLGRALVEAALAWGRDRAALDVSLRVSERNEPARRLYLACGFRPTGRRERLRTSSEIETFELVCRQRPLVMGVVNVTPNSFTDGTLDPEQAVAHALQLRDEGADLLDVGGEATNPRAAPVTADEELRRVMPVVERLVAAGARVSVDTTKAEVARAAVAAGAHVINDVSGGLFDPAIRTVLGDATYIAGHLRGRSISEVFSVEGAVTWQEVASELGERLAALPAGVNAWVDPGIGFGKGADPQGNLELLRHAGDISAAVGRPIVVGPSRKRFLRRLIGGDPDLAALDLATLATSLGAVRGGAHVVRVHNVTLLRTALTVYTKE